MLGQTNRWEKRATHKTGVTLIRFTKQEADDLGISADDPYKLEHYRY